MATTEFYQKIYVKNNFLSRIFSVWEGSDGYIVQIIIRRMCNDFDKWQIKLN